MKQDSIFKAGLAIMTGLIVLGIMIPVAVTKVSDSQRVVHVKGLCEREVPADKVIWPVKFKVVGNDLSQVFAEIERKNAAVLRFLEEGGIERQDITVGTPAISDKFAQEYGSNDRAFRYVASSTLIVCTHAVDKVLERMSQQSDLLRSGIAPESDWDCHPDFSFEGLNGIKPEMIQEATENAREAALKFATDSRSRLGKIKTATQGTFSISDRDSNTPSIKTVRVVTNVSYFLSR